MEHIAPELRDALLRDQEELCEAFRAVGADLRGQTNLYGPKFWARRAI